MGAWAGKRQRPRANMDNARSLDQSCVDYEFIKSEPLETRGARVLTRILPRPAKRRGNCPVQKDAETSQPERG